LAATSGPIVILIVVLILVFVVSAENLCDLLLHSFESAFGLVLGTPAGNVVHQLWKSFGPILRQIKPVHGLGETQVSVDTGMTMRASIVSSSMPTRETRT
jgi:H+/gluconate symporter-like permease